MLLAHLASSMLVKTPMAALLLFQSGGGTPRFDLWQMWLHMGWPARSIAIILLVMSARLPGSTQAVAPVRPGSRGRSARRQTGRGHPRGGAQQEKSSGQGCKRGPSGISCA